MTYFQYLDEMHKLYGDGKAARVRPPAAASSTAPVSVRMTREMADFVAQMLAQYAHLSDEPTTAEKARRLSADIYATLNEAP